MSKQDLLRKFNYVQADLTYAGNMAKRTTNGARLGWLKKYISLFSEYITVKREMKAVFGFKKTDRLDNVEALRKDWVFRELNKHEDRAWKGE